MKIFHKYIGFLNKPGKDFLSVGSLCVESKRFLVGIQLKEVVRRLIGSELKFLTCSVAYSWTLDFYYIGSEPCQHLCT